MKLTLTFLMGAMAVGFALAPAQADVSTPTPVVVVAPGAVVGGQIIRSIETTKQDILDQATR